MSTPTSQSLVYGSPGSRKNKSWWQKQRDTFKRQTPEQARQLAKQQNDAERKRREDEDRKAAETRRALDRQIEEQKKRPKASTRLDPVAIYSARRRAQEQ